MADEERKKGEKEKRAKEKWNKYWVLGERDTRVGRRFEADEDQFYLNDESRVCLVSNWPRRSDSYLRSMLGLTVCGCGYMCVWRVPSLDGTHIEAYLRRNAASMRKVSAVVADTLTSLRETIFRFIYHPVANICHCLQGFSLHLIYVTPYF